jgi:hypothetical protein
MQIRLSIEIASGVELKIRFATSLSSARFSQATHSHCHRGPGVGSPEKPLEPLHFPNSAQMRMSMMDLIPESFLSDSLATCPNPQDWIGWYAAGFGGRGRAGLA